MESYLGELNASEFRRNGTPLQYLSIVVWFKNARVKYRHLLRSSAIAQMREDIGYGSDKSSSRLMDECKECDEEDEDEDEEEELVVEEKEMEEEVEEKREEEKAQPAPTKSPARSSAKSPARSPSKSPMTKTYEVKEEPVEESAGNENQVTATTLAKPVILPSLLHMQARPHLQPVSIVSNGLIVPSRLHNGAHHPEAALQVPDLRKIASGFGISLTPEMAAAAHGMPIPSVAHAHYLHSLELMHKDNPALRMDYHNGALSVPKPTPTPLTAVSTSQQRTTTTQSSKPHQESSKPAKSSPTTNTQAPTQRVPRKRFTIDPTFEVPKLQSWFAIDPRPDRQTIERYVQELNSSEWRRHQPKYNNRVVYVWFKNARAKYSKMQNPSPDMEHSIALRMHHEAELAGDL